MGLSNLVAGAFRGAVVAFEPFSHPSVELVRNLNANSVRDQTACRPFGRNSDQGHRQAA